MKRPYLKLARRLLDETRGSDIVEAAAVLPIMFMILLGIFWFGQAFNIYGAITRAAQDGARAGSAPICTTCTPPQGYTPLGAATTAVNNALLAAGLDPNLAQSTSYPTPTACAGYVSSLSCGKTGPCVQFPVQLLTNAQGGGDCGILVYFQYPFQLWLPFTSVNNQQILLTASASARMETN